MKVRDGNPAKDGEAFRYELLPDVTAVRNAIAACEGKHVQQAVYSTFMGTLTQICFTERVIRGLILWDGGVSWHA